MSFTQALQALFNDDMVIYALIIVLIDFILGVAAAFYKKTFRLSYIADFARNDVLAKLVPWAALYIGAKLAPNAGTGVFDLGLAAGSLYAVVVAAWIGSILSSLADLGLKIGPSLLTGGEKT